MLCILVFVRHFKNISQHVRECSLKLESSIYHFRLYLNHYSGYSGFKSWLQDNGHPTDYITLTNAVEDIIRAFSAEKFNRLLTMTDFIKIFDLFKMYSEEDKRPLKKFWRSYLYQSNQRRQLVPPSRVHQRNAAMVFRL